MIMRAFYFTNLNLVASGIHKLWQSSRRGGSAQAGFTGLLWWCECVICFETLNPCNGLSESQNCMVFKDETSADLVDLNESDGFRPKSPILCKPSIEAMEAAIRIANIDPKKTVRIILSETRPRTRSNKKQGIPQWKLTFYIFFRSFLMTALGT